MLDNLILSVKRGVFRGDDSHSPHGDSAYSDIKPAILKRDNMTCQYCGFRSEKFQHIHHVDNNHSNNDESNLITACPLCHMCFHIGIVGTKGLGTLIYLNQDILGDLKLNITQAKLNHIVRCLWMMEKKNSKSEKAQAYDYLKRLEQARVDCDKVFSTCDPILLANKMLEISDKDYSERDNRLRGMFFLPYKEMFQREIAYWSSTCFKSIIKYDWSDIAKHNMTDWVSVSDLPNDEGGIKAFLRKKGSL